MYNLSNFQYNMYNAGGISRFIESCEMSTEQSFCQLVLMHY